MDTALDEILFHLDYPRGGILTSSDEDSGQYKRWAIGFTNPLEISSRGKEFSILALSDRAQVLLPTLHQFYPVIPNS